MKKERQFQLEVDWIKALPGGCAGIEQGCRECGEVKQSAGEGQQQYVG